MYQIFDHFLKILVSFLLRFHRIACLLESAGQGSKNFLSEPHSSKSFWQLGCQVATLSPPLLNPIPQGRGEQKSHKCSGPTGCPQKNAFKIVSIISPATHILDDWGISPLKGGICSVVWSTKIFLYVIRKARYK